MSRAEAYLCLEQRGFIYYDCVAMMFLFLLSAFGRLHSILYVPLHSIESTLFCILYVESIKFDVMRIFFIGLMLAYGIECIKYIFVQFFISHSVERANRNGYYSWIFIRFDEQNIVFHTFISSK